MSPRGSCTICHGHAEMHAHSQTLHVKTGTLSRLSILCLPLCNPLGSWNSESRLWAILTNFERAYSNCTQCLDLASKVYLWMTFILLHWFDCACFAKWRQLYIMCSKKHSISAFQWALVLWLEFDSLWLCMDACMHTIMNACMVIGKLLHTIFWKFWYVYTGTLLYISVATAASLSLGIVK